jgi:hypothetical protein
MFSIQSGGYAGDKRIPMHGGKTKWGLIGAGIGSVIGVLNILTDKTHGKKSIPIFLGGIGASTAIGALLKWILNGLDQSVFNSKLTAGSAYKLIDTLDAYILGTESDTTVKTTNTDDNGNSTEVSTTSHSRKKHKLEGLVYDIDGNPDKYMINILYDGTTMILTLNNPSKSLLSYLNDDLDSYCHNYKYMDYRSKLIGKNKYIVEIKTARDTAIGIPYNLYTYGYKFNIITGR